MELTIRQRQREFDAAEERLEEASALALRQLLGNMQAAVRSTLTASAPRPGSRRMTSDFFTLGQTQRWWDEAVDEHVVNEVRAVWEAGRAAVIDDPVSEGTLDRVGDYVANVKDRLSRTAQPPIPDQAFNSVRTAVASEIARGSSTQELSRRIASELNWTGPDVSFWEGRKADAEQRISSILDTYGPKGDPTREAVRRTDPTIRQLQAERSDAVKALDADRSQWQTRAERIARTESTGAYNAGAQQAYDEAGVEVRMWVATGDDRTREAHLAASGQCQPQGSPFSVGGASLMYPGDPSGPAELVINCRCTTVAGRDCDELGGIMEGSQETIDAEQERRDEALREAGEPVPMPQQEGESLATQDFAEADEWRTTPDGEREVEVRSTGTEDYAQFDGMREQELEQHFGVDGEDRLRMNESALTDSFEDTQEAVRLYQSGDHELMNNLLRTGEGDWQDIVGTVTGRNQQRLNTAIRRIDEAVDAAPRTPQAMTTYRGVSGDYADRLRNAPVGSQIQDRGFMSTSTDPSVARSFGGFGGMQMQVEVPEGSRAIFMNAMGRKSIFANESELMLGRGAILEVVEQSEFSVRMRLVGYRQSPVPG